jgi:Tfp pilus assembly protein PilO
MTARRVLLIVVALSMIFGWYYFAYTPTRRDLTTYQEQITASQAQLTDFQTTIAQLPGMIKASENMNAQKQRQASVLFGKNEILHLIEQIRTHASAEHLTITDIEPPISELLSLRTTAAIPGEPLFLNITVRMKGDYLGFGFFVERIEKLPYFRSANFCSILGSPDQSTPVVYTLGFKALLGEGNRG